ncbi:hypothetical protein UFOVP585_60 [uncultured Caudovirales phage]|uniref:Uncharacterized protein n=1 Tax=uncultured Caudovirales phage TaxID=2100421 RepID=A0A6J5N962_9CAUD|nr:hypothetical protein UFOVP585_60 [uncultured Caudovirales phage]
MSRSELRTIDRIILRFADQITTLITKLHHKEITFDEANTISNDYQIQVEKEVTEWAKSLLPAYKDDTDPFNNLNAQEAGEIIGFNEALAQIQSNLDTLTKKEK